MRRTLMLALTLALALALTGCAPTPAASTAPATASATQASAFPLTLTDDANRTVTIPALPARIISIAPSNTEMLFAVGAGDRVVAVDRYSDYPAAAKTKESLGSYLQPDIEKLVAAAPDLVLATDVHVKQVIPQLEARHITVFVLAPSDLDGVLDRIGIVGRITGSETAARELVGRLRERIDAVARKVNAATTKPRAFFELDPKLFTAGPGTFIDDLLRRAGATNIAADAPTRYPKLSTETVVLKDPEVIILADEASGETPEKVRARPGWQGVSAVRANRIIFIDPNLTNRPGPRLVDGLETLARALHPELFR